MKPYPAAQFPVLVAFVILAGGCAAPGYHPAAEAYPLRASAGFRIAKPVRTWKDLKEDQIVMQERDFSCGAAALATLMTYYFEEPRTEKEILDYMLESIPEEGMADLFKKGFSLLDLKHCAEHYGYQAVGVKLNASHLPHLKGPILVHIDKYAIEHFAVLRGVRGNRVFLSDPRRGNIRMSLDKFMQEWTRAALVMGKQGFGLPMDFPLSVRHKDAVPAESISARRARAVLPTLQPAPGASRVLRTGIRPAVTP